MEEQEMSGICLKILVEMIRENLNIRIKSFVRLARMSSTPNEKISEMVIDVAHYCLSDSSQVALFGIPIQNLMGKNGNSATQEEAEEFRKSLIKKAFPAEYLANI